MDEPATKSDVAVWGCICAGLSVGNNPVGWGFIFISAILLLRKFVK